MHVRRIAHRVEQHREIPGIEHGQQIAIEAALAVEQHPAHAHDIGLERGHGGCQDMEQHGVVAAADGLVALAIAHILADLLGTAAGDQATGGIDEQQAAHPLLGHDHGAQATIQQLGVLVLDLLRQQPGQLLANRVQGIAGGLQAAAQVELDRPGHSVQVRALMGVGRPVLGIEVQAQGGGQPEQEQHQPAPEGLAVRGGLARITHRLRADSGCKYHFFDSTTDAASRQPRPSSDHGPARRSAANARRPCGGIRASQLRHMMLGLTRSATAAPKE